MALLAAYRASPFRTESHYVPMLTLERLRPRMLPPIPSVAQRAARRLALILAALWLGTHPAFAACCGPITPPGQQLRQFLDQSNVEHLWLPQEHVHWLTGLPDLKRPGHSRHATHCSAYVAAMSVRLDVPLLRPPEHRAGRLATPQTRWLDTTGTSQGWRAVDMRQAQTLANQGDFVLAAWANPNPRRSGHIAIVRPSMRTTAELEQRGPELTMAGHLNALRISTERGFEDHPGAWIAGGQGTVRFFAHAVDWTRVKAQPTLTPP